MEENDLVVSFCSLKSMLSLYSQCAADTVRPEVFAKSAVRDQDSEEDDSVVGKMPPEESDDE